MLKCSSLAHSLSITLKCIRKALHLPVRMSRKDLHPLKSRKGSRHLMFRKALHRLMPRKGIN